jgi:hypothetical protein
MTSIRTSEPTFTTLLGVLIVMTLLGVLIVIEYGGPAAPKIRVLEIANVT